MRWLFLILLTPAISLALHLPFVGHRRSPVGTGSHAYKAYNVLAAMDDDNKVYSTRDVLYIANVTVEGVEYPLQMDTGSSDLWLDMGDTVPDGQTETTYNLTYGSGFAYGHIVKGPVGFAGYNVPEQAFLRFESGSNPVFHFDAVGIVGLGFTGLSHLDVQVSESWGHSLLYNIFSLNPTQPNYIAMALERSLDPSNEVEGSLGVGEVADAYADVLKSEHISLFPPEGSTRWTLLLDSYAVDGVSQTPSSVVHDVPAGRVVALLDSGTTYNYAPPEVASSIYSSIPGAVLDTTLGQWSVPCSAGKRVTIWINGKPFDIHPLDVVVPSLSDPTQCIGSFIPQKSSVGASEFDWILGTTFLRSVYAVYDFGDFDSSGAMGSPYIQLLSVVDINTASQSFQTQRGGTVNVDSGNGSPSPSITVETTGQKLDRLISTIPLLFAILGANALIMMTILVIVVWFCCQQRRKTGKEGKKFAPLPLTTVASSNHAYESVPTGENEGRPASIRSSNRPSRPASRMLSRTSLSGRSIRDDLTEPVVDNSSRSSLRYSLLRPAINISSEDVGSRRSSRVPDSRRSSKLPGGDTSPVKSLQQSPSPSPTRASMVIPDPPSVDATPVEEGDITENLKKQHFEPPPPIVAPGYRRSMYSDISASPTAAGSEQHFNNSAPSIRERTISQQFETMPLMRNSMLASPSPTEGQFEDQRASYYSQGNASVPSIVAPSIVAGGPQVFPAVQENPLQEALIRAQQQEAQRAAFMAALDDQPLPPARRPRLGASDSDPRSRMSAYQTLSPTQETFAAGARLNRHSYAAPPMNAQGAGPQRSSYMAGSPLSRRGPFVSNPSPFNPSHAPVGVLPPPPPTPPTGSAPNRPPPPPPPSS